jgi:hypothetical protein
LIKCSICSDNWADCIHTGPMPLDSAARGRWLLRIGGSLLVMAAIAFIAVMIWVAV